MQFSKADLHIHSNFSDGLASIDEILEYTVKYTDLNIIAITDHDTIKGALQAKKIAKNKKLNIKIIIGEEISTKQGHLIGLFLKKTIPSGLTLKQTIQEIKKQNGLIIASHPFYQTKIKDPSGNEIGGIGITNFLKHKHSIDALETINGNLVMKFKENKKTKYINLNYFLKPEIGGSDSHVASSVGKAYTVFKGSSISDFKKAIINNQTQAFYGQWNIKSILEYSYYQSYLFINLFIYFIKNEFSKKNTKVWSHVVHHKSSSFFFNLNFVSKKFGNKN